MIFNLMINSNYNSKLYSKISVIGFFKNMRREWQLTPPRQIFEALRIVESYATLFVHREKQNDLNAIRAELRSMMDLREIKEFSNDEKSSYDVRLSILDAVDKVDIKDKKQKSAFSIERS